MKIGFTLKDINVSDKATIGEVNIQVQYQAGELEGEYKLFRQVLKEIPEIVADLGEGATAFGEMDNAVNEAQTSGANIIDTMKIAINKIRQAV